MRHEFLHAPDVRGIAQVLFVDSLDGGQAFVSPEPLPRGRLTVRAVDAGCEVQRWAARETGLSGHHGQRGDPGEQALLPEPQRRPLLREQLVNHHPLVERQPVHHDERDLPPAGFLQTPREQPGNLVDHHRRRRWQIVQRLEALPDPGGKRLVDPIADAAVPFQSGPVERAPVGAEDERVHLRPAWCESEPRLVWHCASRNRLLNGLQQPVEPAPAMRLRVDLDTGQRPRIRHCMPAGMRKRVGGPPAARRTEPHAGPILCRRPRRQDPPDRRGPSAICSGTRRRSGRRCGPRRRQPRTRAPAARREWPPPREAHQDPPRP